MDMTGNATLQRAVLAVVAAVLVGCGDMPAPAPGAEGSAPRPTFTVLGIDRSDGDATTRQGLEVAKAYVLSASPCDRLQFRWVSHQSFLASEVLGDLLLPCLPEAATAFDASAERRYRQALAAVEQSRRDALVAFDGHAERGLGSTPRTDIVGFVAAASAVLADAPEYAPALVLISDFEDNLQRSATVDLTGVRVSLHLVGGQVDPERAQSLIATWIAAFTELGADAVRLRSDLPRPYVPRADQ